MPRTLAAIAFLLTLLSLALGAMDRFEPTGDNLIQNADFEQGLMGWSLRPARANATVTDGELHLNLRDSCPDGWCRAQVVQDVPGPGPAYVRMTGKIRWKGVVLGNDTRDRGPRLHLSSHRQGRDRVWHTAFHPTLVDDSGEAVFSEDRFVWGDRDTWGVWLHLSGVEGEVWMDEVTLHRLAVARWWQACFWMLVLAWTGLVAVLLWPVAQRALASVPHGGVVVVSLGILAGTLAPDVAMNPIRDQIAHIATAVLGPLVTPKPSPPQHTVKAPAPNKAKPRPVATDRPSAFRLYVDKLAHFGAFALLALCAWLAAGRDRLDPRLAVAAVVAFAPVTEVLQGLTLGRSPRVADVGIDVLGIVLGALIGWACTTPARSARGHA